jgi:hypothetical protein
MNIFSSADLTMFLFTPEAMPSLTHYPFSILHYQLNEKGRQSKPTYFLEGDGKLFVEFISVIYDCRFLAD